jgi:hypothetical protein
MISNLRFDGHGVFAGVYDAAAHYYALHLVCHLEATVVGGVVCFGGLLRAEVSWGLELDIQCSDSALTTLGGKTRAELTLSMGTSGLLSRASAAVHAHFLLDHEG